MDEARVSVISSFNIITWLWFACTYDSSGNPVIGMGGKWMHCSCSAVDVDVSIIENYQAVAVLGYGWGVKVNSTVELVVLLLVLL